MRKVPAGAPPVHPLMRVPVPAVFVLSYLLGLVPQLLLPAPVASPWQLRMLRGAGLILLAAGGSLAAWCLILFRRGRTTTIPFGGPTTLVTSGPYRLARNPMYVSLALLYVGEAAWLAQAWPIVPLALTLVYLDRIVVPYEESILSKAFGPAYEAYRARVGRWMRRL